MHAFESNLIVASHYQHDYHNLSASSTTSLQSSSSSGSSTIQLQDEITSASSTPNYTNSNPSPPTSRETTVEATATTTTTATSSNGGQIPALFALLVLINLIVIMGNILVIVAVYASAKLRSVTNIFIVSLATADLLLGILVLPYALVYEVLDSWIFGQIWCRGWLVTDVWISTASILNLCAISIDRYVAVTRPVKYRSIMTRRRAKCIVAIVWLLSFIICFPPLLTELRPTDRSIDLTAAPPQFAHYSKSAPPPLERSPRSIASLDRKLGVNMGKNDPSSGAIFVIIRIIEQRREQNNGTSGKTKGKFQCCCCCCLFSPKHLVDCPGDHLEVAGSGAKWPHSSSSSSSSLGQESLRSRGFRLYNGKGKSSKTTQFYQIEGPLNFTTICADNNCCLPGSETSAQLVLSIDLVNRRDEAKDEQNRVQELPLAWHKLANVSSDSKTITRDNSTIFCSLDASQAQIKPLDFRSGEHEVVCFIVSSSSNNNNNKQVEHHHKLGPLFARCFRCCDCATFNGARWRPRDGSFFSRDNTLAGSTSSSNNNNRLRNSLSEKVGDAAEKETSWAARGSEKAEPPTRACKESGASINRLSGGDLLSPSGGATRQADDDKKFIARTGDSQRANSKEGRAGSAVGGGGGGAAITQSTSLPGTRLSAFAAGSYARQASENSQVSESSLAGRSAHARESDRKRGDTPNENNQYGHYAMLLALVGGVGGVNEEELPTNGQQETRLAWSWSWSSLADRRSAWASRGQRVAQRQSSKANDSHTTTMANDRKLIIRTRPARSVRAHKMQNGPRPRPRRRQEHNRLMANGGDDDDDADSILDSERITQSSQAAAVEQKAHGADHNRRWLAVAQLPLRTRRDLSPASGAIQLSPPPTSPQAQQLIGIASASANPNRAAANQIIVQSEQLTDSTGTSSQRRDCALFHDKTYVVYSALGSFYIPMLVMVFFYSRIYLVASRAQKAMARGYMTTKWPPMLTGGKLTRANSSLSSTSARGKSLARNVVAKWASNSTSASTNNNNNNKFELINGKLTADHRTEQVNATKALQNCAQSAQLAAHITTNCSTAYTFNNHHLANDDQEASPERVTLRIHRRTEPPPEDNNDDDDDDDHATGLPQTSADTTAHHSTGEPAGGSGGGVSGATGSADKLPRSSVLALLRGVRTLGHWRSNQANASAPNSSSNNNNNNLVKLTAVEQRQASRTAGACRTQFNLLASKTIAQQQQQQHSQINSQSSADRQQSAGPPAASEAIAQPPPPPPPPLHFSGRARRASSIVRREATIEEEADNNNSLPQIRIDDQGLELKAPEAEPEVSKARRGSAPALDCCVVRPHRPHHHHHHHRHHHRHRHHRHHCHHNQNHHHHHHHHNHHHRHKLQPEPDATPTQDAVATPIGVGPGAEVDELESVSSVQISIQDYEQEVARTERSHSVDLVVASTSSALVGEPRSQSQRGGGVGGEALPMLVVSWNPNESTTTTIEPAGNLQAADEHQRLGGSGLSLVTSQVRKQSMMLLSSLSTRSSQTLRRLSMVAAHPMDSLSGRLKSRTGSRHHDGESVASGWSSDAAGAMSSDDPDATREFLRGREQVGVDGVEVGDRKLEKKLLKKRRRKQVKRKRVAKELARKLSKKSSTHSNEVRNNSLASGGGGTMSPVAQLPSSPKKTLDDYLMAVAGIDNSSSSGASGDDDDDDDDDEDINDNEDESDDTGSGSSNEDLEAGASRGGGMKLAALLKREHLLIPSITIAPSSDEQSSRSPGSPASSVFKGQPEVATVTQSHSDDTTAADKQLDCSAAAAAAGQSSSARTSIVSFRSFTADALLSTARVGVGANCASGKRNSLDEVEVKVKRTDRLPPSAGLHRQGGLYESHTSQRASSAEALEEAPLGVGVAAVCPAPTSPDLFKLERPAVGRLSESALQAKRATATVNLTEVGVTGAARRRGAKRTSRWHAKRLRAETKAAKTVAIIVGGFIFCWLPFFTAYLTRALLCATPTCVPQTWLSLFIWLGYLNSAINPVIYGLFSADFRHAFKNIVCRCSLRAPSPRAQQRAANNTNRAANQQADDTATVSFLVDSIIKSIL